MANTAINLTGAPTPSGNMPFLLYTPPVTNKKQPLIIFLHGAGEGSFGLPHDATSVRVLENRVGLPVLTKSADLPGFVDDFTGETFHFYTISPQQYYPANTGNSGSTWEHYYVINLIEWAKNNLNIDHGRIYLTGLSLGGGGTVDCLGNALVNTQIAAAVSICPGYGNGVDQYLTNIARSGVPLWITHADNDTVTNPCKNSSGQVITCSSVGLTHGGELVGSQIARRINAKFPLVPVRYHEYVTGGHGIWYRMYDVTEGDSYTKTNGINAVQSPGFFRWLLRHRKLDTNAPLYIPPA